MNKYEAHLESEIEIIDNKIKADTQEAEAAEQRAKALRERLAILEKKKVILVEHHENLKGIEPLDEEAETVDPGASAKGSSEKAQKNPRKEKKSSSLKGEKRASQKDKNSPSGREMLMSVFRQYPTTSLTSSQAAHLALEQFPDSNKKYLVNTCYDLLKTGEIERFETSPITFKLVVNAKEENEGPDEDLASESAGAPPEQEERQKISPSILDKMRNISA